MKALTELCKECSVTGKPVQSGIRLNYVCLKIQFLTLEVITLNGQNWIEWKIQMVQGKHAYSISQLLHG
jgi:hypothetical protein